MGIYRLMKEYPGIIKDALETGNWISVLVLVESIAVTIFMAAVGGSARCREEHPKLGAAVAMFGIFGNMLILAIADYLGCFK